MAEAQGRTAQTIVQEAIERLLCYEEWFSREVGTGLAAAENAEFGDHHSILRMIESRYPSIK